jgi:hypothetical protein
VTASHHTEKLRIDAISFFILKKSIGDLRNGNSLLDYLDLRFLDELVLTEFHFGSFQNS